MIFVTPLIFEKLLIVFQVQAFNDLNEDAILYHHHPDEFESMLALMRY